MEKGLLYKNDCGRYQITGSMSYFTCGSVVEVKVGNRWRETRIEHNDQDYYFVAFPQLPIQGALVRVRQ